MDAHLEKKKSMNIGSLEQQAGKRANLCRGINMCSGAPGLPRNTLMSQKQEKISISSSFKYFLRV
jgi:hypothetical protein